MTAECFHDVALRVIEIVAAISMMSGVGVLAYRICKGPTNARKIAPLGARSIQFVAVTMGLPLILILGLENKLDSSAIGTLIGGFFGYVLSHVGRYDPRKIPTSRSSSQDDSEGQGG